VHFLSLVLAVLVRFGGVIGLNGAPNGASNGAGNGAPNGAVRRACRGCAPFAPFPSVKPRGNGGFAGVWAHVGMRGAALAAALQWRTERRWEWRT
jgi:hypothetical protein